MSYQRFADIVVLPQLRANDVSLNINWKSSARRSWPFKSMKIGESVFIEGGDEAESNLARYVYRLAKSTGKSNGWEFVGRKVDGGIRIWRVK